MVTASSGKLCRMEDTLTSTSDLWIIPEPAVFLGVLRGPHGIGECDNLFGSMKKLGKMRGEALLKCSMHTESTPIISVQLYEFFLK